MRVVSLIHTHTTAKHHHRLHRNPQRIATIHHHLHSSPSSPPFSTHYLLPPNTSTTVAAHPTPPPSRNRTIVTAHNHLCYHPPPSYLLLYRKPLSTPFHLHCTTTV
ncbi:hypothetical protein HanPI659440_Chr00c03g0709661 [Helianthus annuus]|nr:hypothetical protein HanPI659440_Chr00c03g0709661 [Helianthus annuus]